MLNHLRQRVVDALAMARTATLSTHGAAGLQASVVPCQALETILYLLVPRTSDHLFNLEHSPEVLVTTETWEMRGMACLDAERPLDLALHQRPDAAWCEVVTVRPSRIQIGPRGGLGYDETIDID